MRTLYNYGVTEKRKIPSKIERLDEGLKVKKRLLNPLSTISFTKRIKNMTYKQRKIEDFIRSFNTPMGEARDKFLHGKCYWFARILYERFSPEYPCRIMYNQIENHFCCYINGGYYDASGLITDFNKEDWTSWTYHFYFETPDAIRVVRDCILNLDPGEEVSNQMALNYVV